MMFNSKLWAAMSAVLLVTLPSLVVYSNVLTPEHLFILVECAIIYAVVQFFKIWNKAKLATGEKQLGKLIFWAIVVALLIGLSGLFRPFSELFLVAFVITLFIYKLPLKWIIVNSLFLILVTWLAGSLPIAVTKYYGHELRANVRPCNLLVGTSFQNAGQYNAEDRALCTKMRNEAPNEDIFAQRVTALVLERVRAQQDDLLPFVDRKFAVLWTNSNGILFWSVPPAAERVSNSLFDVMRKINYADFVLMFLISIICALGTAIALIKDVKPGIFFCLLAFWGFNLMEIIFEIQTRYRTVVMPLLIFFACWILSSFAQRLEQSSPGRNPLRVLSR
jgi:hypothetical protein